MGFGSHLSGIPLQNYANVPDGGEVFRRRECDVSVTKRLRRTQGTVAVLPGGASPTPPRRKPPGTWRGKRKIPRQNLQKSPQNLQKSPQNFIKQPRETQKPRGNHKKTHRTV